jgi:hypothetical protein
MLDNYSAESTESIISPEKESKIRDVDTSSGSNKSLQTFELFHNDKLFSPNTKFAFNDPNLGILFRGAIAGVSPIITETGQVVENATLGDILKKANYANFLDTDKIFFGTKNVSSLGTDHIIYDENQAAKIYMPVSANGSPDYEEFQRFKDIYSIYEANKNN